MAGYALIDGRLHRQIDDHLTTDAFDWASLEDVEWSIVGDRPDWLGASPREYNFEEGFELKIGSILTLAKQDLVEEGSVDAEMALPVYLSADSPWRPVRP